MPKHYTPGPLPFLPFTQCELICEQCAVRFLVSRKLAGRQRFCSQACFGASCRTAVTRPCERCGQPFQAVPSEVAKGKGRLCSKSCADAALVVPLLDRIRSHVDVRGADECWPWTAKRHARGYGETTDRGKNLRVTRVLLEQKMGRPLAPDEFALHTCSFPPCCNPAHLFAGDHQQNMDQRRAEGKYAAGERHHNNTRLTDDAVREIRRRAADGEPSPHLAREYGIAHSTVRRLILGLTWRHVTSSP